MNLNEVRIQAKRNRRSRRLQKKNSLDVQFRRRFSMLRDGNVANNSIYNSSEVGAGFGNGANESALTNGLASGLGRESRTSGMLGPRASYGNLSSKLLDKRFNKLLINMPSIPPNKSEQQLKQKSELQQNSTTNVYQKSIQESRRRKSGNIADEHV